MNCLTSEVLYLFFLSYAGKKQWKILWPGLPSGLTNPRWDSEDSRVYAIPSGQEKSRPSVMVPLVEGWRTLDSPCSEVVQNGDLLLSTPFCFISRTCLPRTKAQQGFMQHGILHWVHVGSSAQRCLLPGQQLTPNLRDYSFSYSRIFLLKNRGK